VPNGTAAERRAEGPSVLAACSAGAGGRTRGGLRRGPVQPGACARLNEKAHREPDLLAIRWSRLLGDGESIAIDFLESRLTSAMSFQNTFSRRYRLAQE